MGGALQMVLWCRDFCRLASLGSAIPSKALQVLRASTRLRSFAVTRETGHSCRDRTHRAVSSHHRWSKSHNYLRIHTGEERGPYALALSHAFSLHIVRASSRAQISNGLLAVSPPSLAPAARERAPTSQREVYTEQGKRSWRTRRWRLTGRARRLAWVAHTRRQTGA